MDDLYISNTVDSTGAFSVEEQQLLTCHLVELFEFGT